MSLKLVSNAAAMLLSFAAAVAIPSYTSAQHGGGHVGGGHMGGGGHIGGFPGGFHGNIGGYHGGVYHGGIYHGGLGGYNGGSYHSGFHYHPFGYSPFYGSYGYPYGYYPYYYNNYPYFDSGYGLYDGTVPYVADGVSSFGATASEPTLPPPAKGTYQWDTRAHISVRLPTDAKMWFDGAATSTTGAVREFNSPPLMPGSHHTYEVRARWTENGKEVTQSQQVNVTSGAHVDVKFPSATSTADRTSTDGSK